jgi:hypothetical protein
MEILQELAANACRFKEVSMFWDDGGMLALRCRRTAADPRTVLNVRLSVAKGR